MLIQRIITAIILIPLVVYGVYYLTPRDFFGVTIVLVAWSAWEWSGLIPLKPHVLRMAYSFMTTALYLLAFRLPVTVVLGGAFIFWLIAIVYVFSYPRFHPRWLESSLARTVKGIFCILPCWISINVLRGFESGSLMMLYFLFLVWGADIGAYFVGKWYGQNKLAPAVSPGKTTEGVFGGLVVCLAIAFISMWQLKLPQLAGMAMVFVAVLVLVASVIGDLFVSVQKRSIGVKDAGGLLPGHGGFIDRVDGMMAAAPVFTFAIIVLGLID